jgi:hypothetical protein
VAAADLGASLTARVTTSQTGYEPLVESLAVPGAVVAATETRARVRPRVGKAVVRVRVKAVGSDVVPSGTVVVIVGRRRRKLRLTDGAAVARFTDLPAGRVSVKVRFQGNRKLQRSRDTTSVRVKPRRG